MRKLSSSMTFVHKMLFPMFWFGFLSVFICIMIPSIIAGQQSPGILLIPLLMMTFGYLLMRFLVFDLVDEVYLDIDQVVIRNGGDEDRFSIKNIINVNASIMTNPERITLTLREPCKFGSEVTFAPTLRLLHFGRHPLAKELIQLSQGVDESSITP
jgi:hypothetical protein